MKHPHGDAVPEAQVVDGGIASRKQKQVINQLKEKLADTEAHYKKKLERMIEEKDRAVHAA